MKSKRFEIWGGGFDCFILDTQKDWSWNKLKKMKCLCNTWVFIRNPNTLKGMVQFVHEVHPVFSITLSTFYHMLYVWNDGTMPSFILFEGHLNCFSISRSISSKKRLNAWNIANEVRTCWNLRMLLTMVHNEHTKRLEFKWSWKNEMSL